MPRAKCRLQRRARRALQQQLRAVHVEHLDDGERHGVIDRDAIRARQRRECGRRLLQERQRRLQRPPFRAQQRLIDERRQLRVAPFGQRRIGEADVVVPRERVIQRVARITRLDHHFAGQARASGPAAHLHQLREKPFARPEIVGKERGIGVQHADQRHALEIVPLRDHLRADQDIHLARVHVRKQRLRAAFAARAVGIDAQHARTRHRARKRLLDALRAASHRRDIDVAAIRTRLRNPRFPAAMVTTQGRARACAARHTHCNADSRRPSRRHRTTGSARSHAGSGTRGSARSVRGALSARRRAAPTSLRSKPGRACAPPPGRSSLHARQHRIGDGAARQRQARVAALVGLPPAFERRRRRAEHDRNGELLRAVDREIAGGVAQAFLLLVSGIVLLVDDDQRQLRQRREDREPRAEHDPRAAGMRGEPVAHAFAFRETAVHRDDRVFGKRGEARAERGFELRRQVDLRHQHERLGIRPRVEQTGERVQIDLGLAAARHAVQQERRETPRGGDRIDGLLLFRRETGEQRVVGQCRGLRQFLRLEDPFRARPSPATAIHRASRSPSDAARGHRRRRGPVAPRARRRGGAARSRVPEAHRAALRVLPAATGSVPRARTAAPSGTDRAVPAATRTMLLKS